MKRNWIIMFCKECGSNIPDDAQFCPYCRDVLKKEEKSPIETPSLDNKLEDDFNLYLDWISENSVFHQYMRTKLYLQVEKLSSSPISGAKVQLSGPPEVDIVIKSRKIHPKKSTNIIIFPISAKKPGIFTLIATLTSDAGHRIEFPFKIQVEPSKTLYSEEPLTKQAHSASYQSEDTSGLELFKCFCYITILVILAIISIIF